MSNTERGEIMTGIYKARADLGVIYARCQEARALHIGVSVQAAQNALNEALEDFKPDAFPYDLPASIPMGPARE